jgi:hypothetical protein
VQFQALTSLVRRLHRRPPFSSSIAHHAPLIFLDDYGRFFTLADEKMFEEATMLSGQPCPLPPGEVAPVPFFARSKATDFGPGCLVRFAVATGSSACVVLPPHLIPLLQSALPGADLSGTDPSALPFLTLADFDSFPTLPPPADLPGADSFSFTALVHRDRKPIQRDWNAICAPVGFVPPPPESLPELYRQPRFSLRGRPPLHNPQ